MSDAAGRRPRVLLRVTMLGLLVVVVFAAFRVLDLGDATLSGRRVRRLLAEAAAMEAAQLYRAAADLYERVSADPSVAAAVRVQAALRLSDLLVERLQDRAGAARALERAYYVASPGEERLAVRRKLEALTGSAPPESPAAAPPAGAPIARIGDETVLLDDVLFAWSRFYGEQSPSGDAFEQFVHWYLDLTLLADEARRQGLDQRAAVQADLKLNRLVSLNRALTQELIARLDAPTSAALQAYYDEHRDAFARPLRVRIRHILAADAAARREVEAALRRGEDFLAVARRHSADATLWAHTSISAEIGEQDTEVRALGPVEGLIPWILRAPDGATTGPLRAARGWAWVQIAGRDEARTPPLEEILDQVLEAYQRRALEQARADLLARLRAERPIEILATPQAERAPGAGTADRPTTPPAAPSPPFTNDAR